MQGLQSDKLALSRLNKTRKNNKSSYNPLQAQKDRNDNLALIAHLREELKKAQDDRRDLVNQLAALKQQPANSTQRLNVSIHQPDPTNYEKAQLQLDTNKKILELTKRNLDEYIEKYQQERDKNIQLQNQLDLINVENDRNKGDKSLLDYYRKREKELEDKISDLCENPFIKTAEERGNVFRQYEEAQRALAEAEKQLREYENINKTLENENRQLKQKYDNVSIEKDKIKEDLIRLQVSTQEKERNEKLFSEQLGLIGQYGEVDSNFGKLINVLKTQAGSNDNW
jgi:chromosome segregation ATPase